MNHSFCSSCCFCSVLGKPNVVNRNKFSNKFEKNFECKKNQMYQGQLNDNILKKLSQHASNDHNKE